MHVWDRVGGGCLACIYSVCPPFTDTLSAFPSEVKPADGLFNHRTNGRFFSVIKYFESPFNLHNKVLNFSVYLEALVA